MVHLGRYSRSVRSLRSPAQKNYFQTFTTGIVGGVVTNYNLAVASSGAHPDGISIVEWPSRIKAIWVDYTGVFDVTPAAVLQAVCLLRKNPGTQFGVPSAANMTGIGNSGFAANVIFSLQGAPGTNLGGENFRFRGWLKIPPRHQVFNESDSLQWITYMGTNTHTDCLLSTYKWRQ